MDTIRKYGHQPFYIGLLHGGPGAPGELQVVAEVLSKDHGILEFIQTGKSVEEQIKELHRQLKSSAELPAILIGHSWGAWLGFIFTYKHPELVKKLILISAGSFENKYNKDLMHIRLQRLNEADRTAAKDIISLMNSENSNNKILKRFGQLMNKADSYDPIDTINDSMEFDINIFKSVWPEAAKLRDTNTLTQYAEKIKIPVVAIHGDYDTNPIAGVEEPLSGKLQNFKMITLKNCGHTPWNERYAKDKFFDILRNELS